VRRPFRCIVAGTLVALFGAACGGKSSTTGDDNQGGSGHGGAVAAGGSGGAVGSGGKVSSGGKVGTGGAVGTAGSVAAAGAAGYAGEACTAPPDPGPCEAYFETWYHDASTGICRPSWYGGCGGNANRYSSLAECQKACSGGTPNYDGCKQASDCTLAGAGCCGVCDGPGLTAHSFIAYSAPTDPACTFGLDRAAPAGGSGNIGIPNPGPTACDPCPAPPPGTGTAHYFVPECLAGQCIVTDVRTSPATACKTSDECKLRRGPGCCEGCDDTLIAVRNDGSFEDLVCRGALVDCASCEENPATGAMAVCANGRCAVGYRAD
jgi:hypothetical protein